MKTYIKRHFKAIELFAEVVILIALFLLGVLLDYMMAASLLWQFNLFMAVFGLILLLPIYLESRRKRELWLFLGFNISLLVLHFVPLNPIKPLTKFYLDIKHGMSIQEVQSLFNQHFPKGGRFPQPKLSIADRKMDESPESWRINYQLNGKDLVAKADKNLHYSFFDPTDNRFNGEFVTIFFKDDKVISRSISD